jgi:hypothetical protein
MDGYAGHVTNKASRKSSSVFYPPLHSLFHVIASLYRRWACWGDTASFRLRMLLCLHAAGAYFPYDFGSGNVIMQLYDLIQ